MEESADEEAKAEEIVANPLNEDGLSPHLIQPATKTTRVAGWIKSGGSKLASSILKGASWTSKKISSGKTYLTTKLKKKDKPTTVSQVTLVRAANARAVSNTVLEVSRSVVSSSVAATSQVAKSIADRFESSTYTQKIVATSTYQSAKEIGGASVSAVVSVYEALEEALFTLAKSSGEAAVDVVRHRYGDQAASATSDSVHSALNVVSTVRVVKSLGPKSLGKKSAKAIARAVLEEKKEA
jgi:spartin